MQKNKNGYGSLDSVDIKISNISLPNCRLFVTKSFKTWEDVMVKLKGIYKEIKEEIPFQNEENGRKIKNIIMSVKKNTQGLFGQILVLPPPAENNIDLLVNSLSTEMKDVTNLIRGEK